MRPSRQDARLIDISTIQPCTARTMLDRLTAQGLRVAVWDITSDIGIPVVQCMLMDATGEVGHTGIGTCCHPDAAVALLKAVIEAAQVRTTYIVGSREDIEPDDYFLSTLQARRARCLAFMDAGGPMRDFADLGSTRFGDMEMQVFWLLERLQLAGMRQSVVVDLTRPEFGIPVVRVVVPGLEGSDHHDGYSPGPRAIAVREQNC